MEAFIRRREYPVGSYGEAQPVGTHTHRRMPIRWIPPALAGRVVARPIGVGSAQVIQFVGELRPKSTNILVIQFANPEGEQEHPIP